MIPIAIIASRTFQPLSVVRATVRALPKDRVILLPGATRCAKQAAASAAEFGLTSERLPLDPARSFLTRLADEGGELIAFAATDPATGKPTSGTAGMIALAKQRGVPVTIIEAKTPGTICERLATILEKADGLDRGTEAGIAIKRRNLYKLAAELVDDRDRCHAKLESGQAILTAMPNHGHGTPEEDRWLRWLETFQAIIETLDAIAPRLGITQPADVWTPKAVAA